MIYYLLQEHDKVQQCRKVKHYFKKLWKYQVSLLFGIIHGIINKNNSE